MAAPYLIREQEFGLEFYPRCEWKPEFTRILEQRAITHIQLNISWGWPGPHLQFLRELPPLHGIRILTSEVACYEPMYHHGESLRSFGGVGICPGGLDFGRLPRLRECGLHWFPQAKSVFGRTSLRTLQLDSYKGKSIEPFLGLRWLRVLGIGNSPLSDLAGIGELRAELRRLEFGGMRKLEDIGPIGALDRLEHLEFVRCHKLRRLDELTPLKHLRVLHIVDVGEIESLSPLLQLPDLEVVHFMGETVIRDGDLSVLRRLPNLKRTAFANRRHYNLRRDDFADMFRSEPAWPYPKLVEAHPPLAQGRR